ncbi:MAG: hypothetical protein ACJ8DC_17010 [Gemmatimonadales bacterium]
MRRNDEWTPYPEGEPAFGLSDDVAPEGAAPETATRSAPVNPTRPGRPHLVVVVTRRVRPDDRAPDGATLITRFWHPRDQRWSENAFESLEHALHMFLEESGWLLRQQQTLDAESALELIFEARREDFTGPTTEALLEEVGLTPGDVADLMGRVKRDDDERRGPA